MQNMNHLHTSIQRFWRTPKKTSNWQSGITKSLVIFSLLGLECEAKSMDSNIASTKSKFAGDGDVKNEGTV